MLTIGQRLKKQREARYLSIEKASDETRIRIVFLRALEADDYSVLPSAAQGRGFLRNYAAYLEINIDEVIAEMQRNAPPPQEVSGPLPQVNLLETDLPTLTESENETDSTPSWIQRLRSAQNWFARPKQESTPEEISTEPAEAILEEESKPAQEQVNELPAEVQEVPVEADQVNAEPEAKTSLLAKLLAFIPRRKPGEEVDRSTEVEEEIVIEEKPIVLEPSRPANQIFSEIGRELRERRELISLTPEEVERHTKLRVAFVKALEEGAFDKLPSTVQTRGMLTNYSTFLDMDTDRIMLRYADALQARRREKYSETPREKIQTEVKAAIPLLRGFIAGDLIFGIVMITVLLALGAWGIGLIASQNEADAQPTSASIVDILGNIPLVTPTPTNTPDPNEVVLGTNAAGNALEVPTLSLDANVVVVIYSVERAFVRIAVDDEVVFEGRIAPFETKQYEAVEKIEILTGNAAALLITYNGQDLGLMGNVGEVTNRVYTVSGVVAPTSTPTPTATNTPLVTNTPTVTITPTRTPTVEPPSP